MRTARSCGSTKGPTPSCTGSAPSSSEPTSTRRRCGTRAVNGADSAYVWTPDEVAAKIRQRTPEEARAEPTFKLGVHFFEQGDETLARTYWERAEQLHPDSWNYHRQDWSFTADGSGGVKFREKRANLGETPYYAPLDLADTPATPPRR